LLKLGSADAAPQDVSVTSVKGALGHLLAAAGRASVMCFSCGIAVECFTLHCRCCRSSRDCPVCVT
jgi:3-oxoacyl-(acyl-carrier-protein) synthase